MKSIVLPLLIVHIIDKNLLKQIQFKQKKIQKKARSITDK